MRQYLLTSVLRAIPAPSHRRHRMGCLLRGSHKMIAELDTVTGPISYVSS